MTKRLRFVSTLLFCLVSILELRASNLSGVIIVDTLKVADSPYIVTGDVSVSAGDTLHVEPGVVVKFNSGLNLTLGGYLKAVGTTTDSIYFTSNLGFPASGDWNGLSFTASSGGMLKYTVVEYSASGVIIANSAPSITNSHIRQNNNGIDCASSATPVIESNAFTANGNTAIRCNEASPIIKKNRIFNNVAISSGILCENSAPTISENLIYDNDNAGIECVSGGNPNIWQNSIVANDFGITLGDSSSPSIKNNIIVSNTSIGVAINDVKAVPVIKYNNVWNNAFGDYFGTSSEVGDPTTTNANGDASDVHFNISKNPAFANAGNDDYSLLITSPSIDAGDPANPAGVVIWGSAPEQGAFEFNGSVPVELVSFSFDTGVLRWMTASEENNFGFEILRSETETGVFSKVGFVAGAGTSTTPRAYEFSDSVSSGVFYYRLKQIDTDGSFALSETIEASYSSPESFTLNQNYPNPFNPSTTISFRIPDGSNGVVKLSVFNARGQEVLVLLNERKTPGSYQLPWNGVDKVGRPVASGVYLYRLEVGDQVQTRPMLLIR